MPEQAIAPPKIPLNEDGSVKLRSIVEIIKDLRKPIAAKHLRSKPAGKSKVTFIPWHMAVKYLDRYAPGWSYDVTQPTAAGGKVFLVATISIPCLEGLVPRSATGQESEKVTGYGDSTSNAESMALRRAAAKFGLGLYLYDPDE